LQSNRIIDISSPLLYYFDTAQSFLPITNNTKVKVKTHDNKKGSHTIYHHKY